jgi:hypothetical protein
MGKAYDEFGVMEIHGPKDVYPAVVELTTELNSLGVSQLAAGLHFRMHQVAWTTGSEFHEEPMAYLGEALEPPGADLPEPIARQMRRIVEVIAADIAERNARARRVG